MCRPVFDYVSARVDYVSARVDYVSAALDHLATRLDQLAAMVANAFQSLQDEMREGFRVVNQRLDDHDLRLGRIERKLDDTIERVNGHDVRLGRLEKS